MTDNIDVASHIMDNGIRFSDHARMTCPFCSDNRRNKTDKVFSVDVKDNVALWFCHHCDEKGSTNLSASPENTAPARPIEHHKEKPIVVVPIKSFDPLSEKQYEYMLGRGISKETCDLAGLVNSNVYIPKREDRVPCIGFPYENADGSTAVKWRDGKKNFTQTGAARSLWNLKGFTEGDLIITEGEIDAISFLQIGVTATSVPNGAPAKASKEGADGKKFSYLWDAKDIISKAKRIIIAGDQDDPAGDILVEELARRLGKAKCWRMIYPPDCKDANDVLVTHGPEQLKKLLDEVTPWPIGGLREANDYKQEAMAIWEDGMSRGVDVTVGNIAEYYRPSPGTLTICTGVPGSGKSTFLTWLSMKLAEQEDWATAIFAAETSSQVHLLQLASIRCKKPFRGPGKMSKQELEDAIDWISGRFVFLDESETSIDSVIERAQAAVLRSGVRVLMVDPFNFITMDRPKEGDNGQHGYNQLLVRLKVFAVEHDVAVWLVAHPTKMYRDGQGNTPIPTGYDISGSAHFFNVADSGITLSREADKPNISRLTSWKARFSWLGKVGHCELGFEPSDGSFKTVQEWGTCDSDYDFGDN